MPTGSEILEHEPGDLTCIVEGGIRLSALRARSRSTGSGSRSTRPATRRSPSARSTISPGPLRHRFGTMRDLVLGVTVVLPTGRCELRRQGREERRRLRPRQALLRLARAARLRRAAGAAAASAAGGVAHRRGAGGLAGAAPLAADAERGRLSPKGACMCSSRGRGARSTRRLARSAARRTSRGRGCARCRRRCRAACAGTARTRCSSGPGRASRTSTQAREPRSPLAERALRASAIRWRRMCRPELIADCVHCGFCLPTCPTYFALARGDGLAARAHLPDAGARRRVDRAERHGRRALRPLPRLHGMRDVVPVGRAVRPADRADARLRGAQPPSRRARRARARRRSSPCSRTGGGCGRRCFFRKLPAPGPLAPLKQIAPPWAAPEWPPRASAGRRATRCGAGGLRRERRLRRRERGDGARAARRGLRRARAARAGLLRRAARPCRPARAGRRARARRSSGDLAGVRLHRHERGGLRLAPEGSRRRERRRRLRAAGASRARSGSRCRCASRSRTRAIFATRRASWRAPRAMLDAIPGLERLEPAEQDICCGSAGIYNIVAGGHRRGARRPQGRRRCWRPSRTRTRAAIPAVSSRSRRRCAAPAGRLPAFHPIELVDASIRGLGRRPARRRPPVTRVTGVRDDAGTLSRRV